METIRDSNPSHELLLKIVYICRRLWGNAKADLDVNHWRSHCQSTVGIRLRPPVILPLRYRRAVPRIRKSDPVCNRTNGQCRTDSCDECSDSIDRAQVPRILASVQGPTIALQPFDRPSSFGLLLATLRGSPEARGKLLDGSSRFRPSSAQVRLRNTPGRHEGNEVLPIHGGYHFRRVQPASAKRAVHRTV